MATTVLAGAQVSPSGIQGPQSSPALPYGYLEGLRLANNATDIANDLDISAGACRDSTNAGDIILSTTLTKRIDANWAAGTNQGGLDTGTVIDGQCYHIFAIRNPTSQVCDVLFSLSPPAPTMPTGYTQKRRIGSLVYAAARYGGWTTFAHLSKHYFQFRPAQASSGIIGTQYTSELKYVNVPYGFKVRADLELSAYADNGSSYWFIWDPDTAYNSGNYTLLSYALQQTAIAHVSMWTNVGGQIYAYLAGGSATGGYYTIYTMGWEDPLDP